MLVAERICLVLTSACVGIVITKHAHTHTRRVVARDTLRLESQILYARRNRGWMPKLGTILYRLLSGYISQWLERLTADQQVPGSNPGVPFILCRGARITKL